MAGQLLPPPELAPSLPPHLTATQRVALWAELVDACDLFARAGLQRRLGPGQNLDAAYRAWHAEQMQAHDAAMLHMMEEFQRRSGSSR